LQKAARAKGLKADGVQMDRAALQQMSGCAVAWVDGDHYLAVYRVEGDMARVQDPNADTPEQIPTETLLRRSGGIFLTLAK
jgi:ABC-type bacteriocin/lantibiotic exporter with double-glycine peptidase domain